MLCSERWSQKLELCTSIWNSPLSSFSTHLRVTLNWVKEIGQSILFAVLTLTLAAAGCQANFGPHDHFCYLYPLYQTLEASLVNNSVMLYALQQAFLPLHGAIPPAISIRICIEVGEIQSESCKREDHSGEPAFSNNTSADRCWWYQWSSSSLLSLLTADELAAFDNIIFRIVYSNIGPSRFTRHIDLVLWSESLPCMPSSNEMEATLTTLLSWVSV